MKRETSLYLDLWRLFAAMTVFVGHVSGQRLTGGLLWQFEPFGMQAVAMFFVLSGFVIGYAASTRDTSARVYAVNRLARVYSVVFPALVLTFVLDAIGRAARPELYGASWGYVADGRLWQFLAGLFFVNQIWGIDIRPGSDLPFWSLGYEIWYYVAFGVAMFAPRRWRVLGLLGVLVVVGPSIAAMFPLWLMGLLGYRLCAAGRLGRRSGWVLSVGTLILWGIDVKWGRRFLAQTVPAPAILRLPEMVDAYLVGALFIAHVVGFNAIAPAFAGIAGRFERLIRWAAGATFTIYLLHLPIAQFLASQVPWQPFSWQTRLVEFIGTTVLLFLLAELFERRKAVWRQGFTAIIGLPWRRVLPRMGLGWR